MSCLPHILWSLIFKIRVLIFLATCSHLNSIPTRILFYVEPAAVNYIELKRFAAIKYHEPVIDLMSTASTMTSAMSRTDQMLIHLGFVWEQRYFELKDYKP